MDIIENGTRVFVVNFEDNELEIFDGTIEGPTFLKDELTHYGIRLPQVYQQPAEIVQSLKENVFVTKKLAYERAIYLLEERIKDFSKKIEVLSSQLRSE